MGCLDKVGGTIIALLIIIFGCMSCTGKEMIPFILGGIVFEILTFAIDPDNFLSFVDSFIESPITGLLIKFIVNSVITAIVIILAVAIIV